MPDDNVGAAGAEPSATCKHNCVTTDLTAELGKGFDNELGLESIELTPDGGRAQLEIKDRLLQPWGIVPVVVYSPSSKAWPASLGRFGCSRMAAGTSSESITTPTSFGLSPQVRSPRCRRRSTAAGASSCG